MSDPRAFWLEVESLFDHLKPVTDPALFAERDPRYNAISDIESRLELPTKHHKYLVSGTIGNGKTSELFHACDRLADKRVVVFLDLGAHFQKQVKDPRALDRLEPWELIGLLGLAIIRASEDRFGHKWTMGQPKRLEAALKALRKADDPSGAEIDVVKLTKGLAVAAGGVGGALLGGPLAAALGAGAAQTAAEVGLKVLEAAADATSWSWRVGPLDNRRRGDQDSEVRQLIDAVNALILDLQSNLASRIVLVVDGLDRIESVERLGILFVESELLGELVCDQVFTVQPLNDVTQRTKVFRAYEYANVPVLLRDDPTKPGPGIAFFRSLVDKRLAAAKRALANRRIEALAGAPIPGDVIDRLAYYSGGVVREFVRMVGYAAGEAWRVEAPQIGSDIVEKVLLDARRAKEMRINSEEIALLERVMEDPNHALPPGAVAQKLLADHRLLLYPNDTPWYFPNPVLTLKLLASGRSRPSTT